MERLVFNIDFYAGYRFPGLRKGDNNNNLNTQVHGVAKQHLADMEAQAFLVWGGWQIRTRAKFPLRGGGGGLRGPRG